jgi:hypothetical protein
MYVPRLGGVSGQCKHGGDDRDALTGVVRNLQLQVHRFHDPLRWLFSSPVDPGVLAI